MKAVKRLGGLCLLVMLGATLSGCVVVPYGYGFHERGGYHDRYHDRDHYGPR